MVSLQVPLPAPTWYLKVTSPDTSPAPVVPLYLFAPPTLAYANLVASSALAGGSRGSLFTETAAEFQALVNALNEQALMQGSPPADPNRGTVVVVTFDCLSVPAGGVHVALSTADSETTVLDALTYVPTAPVTDSLGLLVFGNVPEGTFEATATPTVSGKAAATVGAFARAGAITEIVLWPTPMTPM
jgi:hypothetical protein